MSIQLCLCTGLQPSSLPSIICFPFLFSLHCVIKYCAQDGSNNSHHRRCPSCALSLSRTTSSSSWVVFILSFQLLNHDAPPHRRVIEWQSEGMSLWVAAVARFHRRWCQRRNEKERERVIGKKYIMLVYAVVRRKMKNRGTSILKLAG